MGPIDQYISPYGRGPSTDPIDATNPDPSNIGTSSNPPTQIVQPPISQLPSPPPPPPAQQAYGSLSKSSLIAKGGTSAGLASGMVVGTLYQVDSFTGPIFGLAQGVYTVSV